MDEATFALQLTDLKHRVSQMAAIYGRRSPICPPASTGDAFHHQLHDVKSRLSSMQDSLNGLTAFPSLSGSSKPHTNDLTLPSGPLFWQLFNSLRTDVRSLHDRVGDLEQNVSDLEDRVGRLDPQQLTPSTSEAEAEQTWPLWNYSEGQTPLASGLPFLQSRDGVQANWYPNHDCQSPSELDTNYGLAQPGAGRQRLENSTNHPHNTSSQLPAESVKFRDREIAQLEELMRGAQDSLKLSEDDIAQKDKELDNLRADQERSQSKIAEMGRTIADQQTTVELFANVLRDKRGEISELRAFRQSAISKWQQSYMEKEEQYHAADQMAHQLQYALQRVKDSRREEIEDAIHAKESEIRRLHTFCESKHTVLRQQEDIIARGAALMEEKDQELDRLGRELKVVRDDLENESRQRERFSKLLDEKDETNAQLRTALNQALMPKVAVHENEQSGPKNSHGKHTTADTHMSWYSPFATSGLEVHSPEAQRWTPKAIPGYAQLPHERRRASCWQEPAFEGQTFGTPGAWGPLSGLDKKSSEQDRRDLRRSNSLKLLRRLALAEEGSSSSMAPQAKSERKAATLEEESHRPVSPSALFSRSCARETMRGNGRNLSGHMSMQDLGSRKLQAYVENSKGGDETCGEA